MSNVHAVVAFHLQYGANSTQRTVFSYKFRITYHLFYTTSSLTQLKSSDGGFKCFSNLFFNRTKYEARDKQQQGRVATLEKEKNSLRDELTNTVNELAQVRVLMDSIIGSPLRTGLYYLKNQVAILVEWITDRENRILNLARIHVRLVILI